MSGIDYCEKEQMELTPEQKIMVKFHDTKGTFIGKAQRQGGGLKYFPACFVGKVVNIIDKAGYYQLGTGSIMWRDNE